MESKLKDYQDSYFSLLSFEKSFRQFNQTKVQGTDLSLGQLMILRYLAAGEGCGQKELTVTFNASSAAMAVSIGKLEEKGLVYKTIDNEDKRNNIISVTTVGREILDATADVFPDKPEASDDALSREEFSQLKKLQNKLFRQLKLISASV